MRRINKFKKRTLKKLAIPAGLALGVGTAAYVGGSLPATMGTPIISAASTATPFIAPITTVSMVGVGIDAIGTMLPIKKLKKLSKKKK